MDSDEYPSDQHNEIIQEFYEIPLALSTKISITAQMLQQACMPLLLATGELAISLLLFIVLSLNVIILTGVARRWEQYATGAPVEGDARELKRGQDG